MARIKKRGLDYFPLNTDFIQNRLVRRIMKREGDGSLAILLGALSYIYAGEGYYVHADKLFYEDLSSNLYEKSADDVKRILAQAVEYGIFDEALFGKYNILTSAEIQSQYIFSTRRRKQSVIDALYCLVGDRQEEQDDVQDHEPDNKQGCAVHNKVYGEQQENVHQEMYTKSYSKQGKKLPVVPVNKDIQGCSVHDEMYAEQQESVHDKVCSESLGKEDTGSSDKRKDVTFQPQNGTSGTHSTAQNSKENPLLNSSPMGNLEDAGRTPAEEYSSPDKNCADSDRKRQTASTRRGSYHEWTEEEIARMQLPRDDTKRNFDGLLYSLHQFHIPPQEQYALVLKSNFGAIGHPIWKGFYDLRDSHGKIRQPGRYLLSLCQKS